MDGMSFTLSFPCSRSPSPPLRLTSFKHASPPPGIRTPRSSGCITCKRRKVRCDETHPACQRCTRAKLDCPGYALPSPPSKRTSFPFKDQTQLTIAKAEGSWTSSRRTNYSQVSPSDPATAGTDPPALNLNATATTLYDSFLENFLPQDRDGQQAGYSYLVDLPSTTASHLALRNATQALSFARLSAKSNDHNLIQHSRVAYGASLKKLRLALSDDEVADEDETLATMLLLGLYELHKTVREPAVGSVNHYFGAGRYIQVRGPESFRTNRSRILLNSHRNSMVVTGLQSHKSIIYEKPEWLNVTRAFAPHDDWSALLDVAVYVPGLVEATDTLVTNPSPACMSSRAEHMLAQLRSARTRLMHWYRRVTDHDADSWLVPLAEIPGMSADLTTSAPFKLAFTARSYNHVHNTLLHSLYTSYVLRAMIQVQNYLMIATLDEGEQMEAETSRRTMEEEHRAELERLVQHFPFMQRPESSVTGWMVLNVAIWFARHACREMGLETSASWCDTVFEETTRQNMVSILDSSFSSFPPLRPVLE